mmetsp:Transcript_15018/g.25706  ORF Transcript_15018/g.25706 Transcript_15018/m.25706 type:complete len:339 (-) Transcript_15018:671-1687(-)|eukprot:CAMPEP_0196657956 /NCGR_PEP_ID=MMETSP1086-20130531/26420_1 /TAXON_ID=77921 /ORGANISM="Cyanoptyche  gloeocystis , Strain SAG4.97" /LENGTH=338 /DNA_ID=CAMNT_0041991285 /DNA_START=63 /DNA_END=1079 /DNA_ORIENTATION=-
MDTQDLVPSYGDDAQADSLSFTEPFMLSDSHTFRMYPHEAPVFVKKRCVLQLLEADSRVLLCTDGHVYLNDKRLIFVPLHSRNRRSFNFPLKNMEDEVAKTNKLGPARLSFRPAGLPISLLCRFMIPSSGKEFLLLFLSLLMQCRFGREIDQPPYPFPLLQDDGSGVSTPRKISLLETLSTHSDLSSRRPNEGPDSRRHPESSSKLKAAFSRMRSRFRKKQRHHTGEHLSEMQDCFGDDCDFECDENDWSVTPETSPVIGNMLAYLEQDGKTLHLCEQATDPAGRPLFYEDDASQRTSRRYDISDMHAALRLVRKMSVGVFKSPSFASEAFLSVRLPC